MSHLVVTTTVPGQPLSGDAYVMYGPGDDVPEWAAVQLGAHCFEGGVHPFPDSNYPGNPNVKAPADADGDGSPDREPGTEPTRNGKGSSRDAWSAFASENGRLDLSTGTRDEIIAALVDAGVIEK